METTITSLNIKFYTLLNMSKAAKGPVKTVIEEELKVTRETAVYLYGLKAWLDMPVLIKGE